MVTRDDEPLQVVAERIHGALGILFGALEAAVAEISVEHERRGYDPDDDKGFFSHAVRRSVRSRVLPVFPELEQESGNMSPVFVTAGPYQLRMVHARDGGVPPASSDARRRYYAANDEPELLLNVFPPDDIVAIDSTLEGVNSNCLLAIWDSVGAEVSQFTLVRPHGNTSHELLALLVSAVEINDDLDMITRDFNSGEDERGEGGGIG